jgi:hypothetical protein
VSDRTCEFKCKDSPVLSDINKYDSSIYSSPETVGHEVVHFYSQNDVVLPQFRDSNKQNIVHFLKKLDEFIELEHVPSKLKSPLAIISDCCTK